MHQAGYVEQTVVTEATNTRLRGANSNQWMPTNANRSWLKLGSVEHTRPHPLQPRQQEQKRRIAGIWKTQNSRPHRESDPPGPAVPDVTRQKKVLQRPVSYLRTAQDRR